ncbi:ribonuclease P protein component [Hoyosella altamirensis]|uniref:ribonuclease P protein component n=1 Tax=Hoyosella altamirensis TaxID=616997 RepID=UPI000944F29B|nr:ribonuclease P protein component [Hoyosella altamirensis]
MLPPANRIRSHREFTKTVRGGVKVGQRDIVLYILRSDETELARTGGPRFGLIVSKAVGNAVERHRVSRVLRHAISRVCANVDWRADVVVRALPRSRDSSYFEMIHQLERGLSRADVLAGAR